MKEYYLRVFVDENAVREASEESDIIQAIKNEAGWMHDSGIFIEEVQRAEDFSLNVPTSAGVIKAYKSADPGQPGIVTMFQPAGYDCEIDAAYVSVYEDEGYQTELKERPVDLVIMAYGDASSEDYTSKDILRRENIMESLSMENDDTDDQPGE